MMSGNPAVSDVQRPLTMQLGPRDVLLCLDVQFKPQLRAEDLVRVIDEIQRGIHEQHPSVRQIFIETDRLKPL